LNSNQIIPISSWSGGSIRDLLLHHLAISLKVLLKIWSFKAGNLESDIEEWYWSADDDDDQGWCMCKLASSSRSCVSNQFARWCAGKLKICMISWRRFKNFQNCWWSYWIKQGPIAIAIQNVLTLIQIFTLKHEKLSTGYTCCDSC
jgi:hypothetical protein